MHEIGARVSWEAMEAIAEELRELGAAGVVVEQEGSHALVKAYLEDDTQVADALSRLQDAIDMLPSWDLPTGPGEVWCSKIDPQEWETAWRALFHPIRLGRRLWLCPPWETVTPAEGEIVVVIDPGMAFGTGEHETTQLCAELLEETIQGGETVADVGTGSGVLAILAARLGAGRVYAIDNDPVAVEAAEENVARNGVEEVVQVQGGHFLSGLKGIDILVANLNTALLQQMLPDLPEALRPGGRIIVSGIGLANQEVARQALQSSGIELIAEPVRGEWCAFGGIWQGGMEL